MRKIDKAVTASYRNRFVGNDDELTELLKDETWLNADEAVALGFADTIADEIEIAELEDEDDEVENFKEGLVAKYAAQTQPNNPQERVPSNTKRRRFF